MFFTDSWKYIRVDRFRIDAPFESTSVFWGKNGFYNTWVTRADGLWVLTVNSIRLTTFIDKDRGSGRIGVTEYVCKDRR